MGTPLVASQQITASLAGTLGLWMFAGAVRYLPLPHWPHNSLYVISDRGELVGRALHRDQLPGGLT
jgi:hypothetical protein